MLKVSFLKRFSLPSSHFQEIGLLRQLMFLDISKNRLEWLPPEIESLHCLTDLFLSNNLLVELPEHIGNVLKY